MKRILGAALVLATLAGCGGPSTSSVPVVPKTTVGAQSQEAKRYTNGWVGSKSLSMNFYGKSASGRYGTDPIWLNFFFDNDISGSIGDQAVSLRNFNGQLNGRIGKRPVYAQYWNGHVSAYNGGAGLNLSEFGTMFSGWLREWNVSISFDRDLTFIQKCGVIAVLLSDLTPKN